MIQLSPTFALPLDVATRRLAILAMSGAGKSNTAVVIAEELYRNKVPWVAIDPKGDWYGLRSNAAGDGPGLPIPVFGGLHGDVPLEAGSGKMMAQLIVEERMTCVLDVSEFDTRADMFRFLADFGEELLKKNREPLHLFLEEADDYLPQTASGKGPVATCLGVWQRVVKRGRFRGIGSTIITQRSAAVNKDALNMAECMFAMRNLAPHDVKAVAGWVQYNGAGKELLSTLGALADGECWIVSPAWLRTTERIHPRRRETFDSGATPDFKKGKTSRVPKTLADIDLDAISARMKATIEKAKADDPKELRKRIALLEGLVRDKTPVIDTDAIAAAVAEATTPLVRQVDADELIFQEIGEIGKRLHEICDGHLETRKLIEKHDAKKLTSPPRQAPKPPERAVAQRPAPAPIEIDGQPLKLSQTQKRILDALAWYESLGNNEPTLVQLGAVALIDATGGHFSNVVGPLSTAGLVTRTPGRISLTDAGRSHANVPDKPGTLSSYHDVLRSRVLKVKSASKRTIDVLNAVIDGNGADVSTEEIGRKVGIDHTGGHFSNTIGPLSTLGLIERNAGRVKPTEVLFPEGLR